MDRAGAGACRSLFAGRPQRRDGNEHRRFLGARRPAAAGTRTRASTSQKINSDVYADLNIAVFGFSEPSSDPCLSALTSTLYVRDLNTGNSALLSGGSVVASVAISGGIAGVALLQSDATASGTPTAVVQVTSMDGAVRSFNANITAAVQTNHRFSWGLVTP